jgi:5'-nucleotidase (lipoprotein e(P4) family)
MKYTVYLALLFSIISCAQKPNPDFSGVLWVQTAAEYQAICYQAYNSAFLNLEKAIADTRWTGAVEQTNNYNELPPAIIFDIDETVLDNSPFQAQLALTNSEYQLSTWDQWIQMQSAKGIAGAVNFINYAQNRGIEIIFISNRECLQRNDVLLTCPQESDTMENLKSVGISGIDEKNILLKNEYLDWGSEKKSRREYIAEKYRIIMIFGDDLGDFIPNVKKNVTPEKRKEMADNYKANWGNKWFIIPNPMYGSWQRILESPQHQYLQGLF